MAGVDVMFEETMKTKCCFAGFNSLLNKWRNVFDGDMIAPSSMVEPSQATTDLKESRRQTVVSTAISGFRERASSAGLDYVEVWEEAGRIWLLSFCVWDPDINGVTWSHKEPNGLRRRSGSFTGGLRRGRSTVARSFCQGKRNSFIKPVGKKTDCLRH